MTLTLEGALCVETLPSMFTRVGTYKDRRKRNSVGWPWLRRKHMPSSSRRLPVFEAEQQTRPSSSRPAANVAMPSPYFAKPLTPSLCPNLCIFCGDRWIQLPTHHTPRPALSLPVLGQCCHSGGMSREGGWWQQQRARPRGMDLEEVVGRWRRQ